MKSTGIVRRVDNLGRIVLPAEIRQTLDIQEGQDSVEIFTENDRIVLQKYQPGCIFCGSLDEAHYFKDNRICTECIAKLKSDF
ncbi:MAG: AbrB/MazE/SpoVT family DNA-binding domain-containing protein [Clostridia bacterium]|nr:AbrB/MazE/SpoVT family DNA-binding domain-containing protein [Clostridia bacterium]